MEEKEFCDINDLERFKELCDEEYQSRLTIGKGLELTDDNVLNVTLDTEPFIVVSVLPEQPEEENKKKLHLIPSSNEEDNNSYDEYLWVNDKWEKMGSFTPEINLSDYLTSKQAAAKYQPKGDYIELPNTSNATNKALMYNGSGLYWGSVDKLYISCHLDGVYEDLDSLIELLNSSKPTLNLHLRDSYELNIPYNVAFHLCDRLIGQHGPVLSGNLILSEIYNEDPKLFLVGTVIFTNYSDGSQTPLLLEIVLEEFNGDINTFKLSKIVSSSNDSFSDLEKRVKALEDKLALRIVR